LPSLAWIRAIGKEPSVKSKLWSVVRFPDNVKLNTVP